MNGPSSVRPPARPLFPGHEGPADAPAVSPVAEEEEADRQEEDHHRDVREEDVDRGQRRPRHGAAGIRASARAPTVTVLHTHSLTNSPYSKVAPLHINVLC